MEFQPNRNGRLVSYTDDSKTKALELGCIHLILRSLALALDQVEVYAIKACAGDITTRGYMNTNSYILLES
jgi:hypothetical protein